MALQIVQWPTGNFGYPRGTHGRNGETITSIVDHIMQGTMAGMHSYLADQNKNSYTFGVSKTGVVEQYVSLADAAWSNGVVNRPNLSIPWIKRCVELAINPNLVTVGIGHEGLSGAPMPEAQVLASIELHKWILSQVPSIVPDANGIVGHFNIDSVNRYYCPGSAFPWARIRAAVAPVPTGGGGHPLPSPDIWTFAGFGSGLVAYCKAHPEYGEYAKTIKNGRVFLHVYRAFTGQIKTITW